MGTMCWILAGTNHHG